MRDIEALASAGHDRWRLLFGIVAVPPSRKGCPAAPRCGCRLPAVPIDVAAINGIKMGSESRSCGVARMTNRFPAWPSDHVGPFVGSLSFVRIYSGVLESGTQTLNTVKNQRERVGPHAVDARQYREDVKEARAGDIVALAGLKNTTTAIRSPTRRIVVLSAWSFRSRYRDRVEPRPRGSGKDGSGIGPARYRGPVLPRLRRSRERQTIIRGWASCISKCIVAA